jgi:ABC-type cobalamin transport system permease subunit
MGVAFVVLLSGSLGGVALSSLGLIGELALTVAAIAGALSIMALIAFASQKVKGNVTLLIIGVMIGYVANAVIGGLKFFTSKIFARMSYGIRKLFPVFRCQYSHSLYNGMYFFHSSVLL